MWTTSVTSTPAPTVRAEARREQRRAHAKLDAMGRIGVITLLLGCGVSWVWVGASACAGTETSGDESSSKQSSTAATGGGGGEGGMAGMGGLGGAGGLGGMGGMGGDPVPCTHDPCKLSFPQCGCGADEKCTVQGAGNILCAPNGSKLEGEACAPGECAAPTICINNLTGGSAQCHEFCESDDQCLGPGSLCVLTVGGGTGVVCSQNCDPVSGVGCSIEGMKCDLAQEAAGQQRIFTRCTGAGMLGQGEVCINSNQCQKGMACFGIPNQIDNECLTWCRTDQGNCPSMTQCAPFQPAIIIGAITYGACL